MNLKRGESSKNDHNKNLDEKVNYTQSCDHTVHMISSFDDVENVITSKEECWNQHANVTTRGQASKVLFLGVTPNPNQATTSSSVAKYDLVNQLLKTLVHISIFELL